MQQVHKRAEGRRAESAFALTRVQVGSLVLGLCVCAAAMLHFVRVQVPSAALVGEGIPRTANAALPSATSAAKGEAALAVASPRPLLLPTQWNANPVPPVAPITQVVLQAPPAQRAGFGYLNRLSGLAFNSSAPNITEEAVILQQALKVSPSVPAQAALQAGFHNAGRQVGSHAESSRPLQAQQATLRVHTLAGVLVFSMPLKGVPALAQAVSSNVLVAYVGAPWQLQFSGLAEGALAAVQGALPQVAPASLAPGVYVAQVW